VTTRRPNAQERDVQRLLDTFDDDLRRLFVAAVKFAQADLDQDSELQARLLMCHSTSRRLEVWNLSWDGSSGLDQALNDLPELIPRENLVGLALLLPISKSGRGVHCSLELVTRDRSEHFLLPVKDRVVQVPTHIGSLPHYLRDLNAFAPAAARHRGRSLD
jgi:hypothetical protein